MTPTRDDDTLPGHKIIRDRGNPKSWRRFAESIY